MDGQWLKTQFRCNPEKSKAELAKALGLEASAISKILNNTRQIKAQEYLIMRRFFGMPLDGEKAAKPRHTISTLESHLHDSHKDGADGQWIIPSEILEQHTQAPSDKIRIFRVADNLMEPEFKRDEQVLVDLCDLTPSPPGAFIVSDGFGYMIRNCEFLLNSKGSKIKITALKSSFQPQILKKEDFKIIGRVIAKVQWL